jgi:mono/diheme cytochrome c family protein
VTGESWLQHLHRPFNETSMDKTGALGPAMAESAQGSRNAGRPTVVFVTQSVTLHGSDLYRLNCQGCHGENGQGAPPEINSVIDPVRATSVTLVMQRMKNTGMDISRTDAEQLAQQARAALLQRLRQGGESMPPFPHLNEAETKALVTYLEQLAGVPGAEHQKATVRESSVRVGEHILKSTCHTCHGAVGDNPTPEQILNGAIPPLETLPLRVGEAQFIRKVTHGAPILMGEPAMLYRGRMPVFYYLSAEEAADVYLYLTLYPPRQSAQTTPVVALLQQDRIAGGGDNPPGGLEPSFIPAGAPQQPSMRQVLETVAMLSAVGILVMLLLAAGLGFTIREFKKLSARNERRRRGKKIGLRNEPAHS